MATIYTTGSMSKAKEVEGIFSTRERAEADLFANEYYLGVIREEEDADGELPELAAREAQEDKDAEYYQEPTDLDNYRYFVAQREAA